MTLGLLSQQGEDTLACMMSFAPVHILDTARGWSAEMGGLCIPRGTVIYVQYVLYSTVYSNLLYLKSCVINI